MAKATCPTCGVKRLSTQEKDELLTWEVEMVVKSA